MSSIDIVLVIMSCILFFDEQYLHLLTDMKESLYCKIYSDEICITDLISN